MMRTWFSERHMHFAFRASLWLKGGFALGEILSGITLGFVSLPLLARLAHLMMREELAEDPHDFIANHIRSAVTPFSGPTLHFAAWYLFGHGIVKLWLIAGLLRRRLWCYPVAMVVFALFVIYQAYRFTLTHSAWLIAISVIDLVVIVLTWYEYRFLRQMTLPSGKSSST